MHCWARYFFIVAVVVLGTLSMIGACGRKGPLYLPEESAPKSGPAASDVPAPAADRPPLRSDRS
jgi:predicted small lipoprotein YifL